MKEVTQKELGETLASISAAFDAQLFALTKDELESQHWHFRYDFSKSVEMNLYRFHDLLGLYGRFCRRWEEHHNGSFCVVERVKDKYVFPKIEEFAKTMRQSLKDEIEKGTKE
jgi:hypothetical protein